MLRAPVATGGEVEALALSALGASGRMSVSFDEGRTTFIAETNIGQLSRLIKVRIGRLGVLWNKAKHIVVYERSTVTSKQFEGEQEWGESKPVNLGSLRGWPVLRKTAAGMALSGARAGTRRGHDGGAPHAARSRASSRSCREMRAARLSISPDAARTWSPCGA